MSEIPEIERLRRAIAEVAYADQPQIDSSTYPHGYFPFEEASQSYRDAAYALADEIMVPIRSALDRQARDFAAAGVSVVEANDPDHEPCAGTGRLVRAWPPGDVGDPCHCVRWELRLDPASALARDLLDRQAREIVGAVRSYRGPSFTSADDVAHFIESRFAPKEADPR